MKSSTPRTNDPIISRGKRLTVLPKLTSSCNQPADVLSIPLTLYCQPESPLSGIKRFELIARNMTWLSNENKINKQLEPLTG